MAKGYKRGTLFGKPVGDVIKRPGALTDRAKAANAYHDGKIDADWLTAEAKRPGRRGREARLAQNMRGFKH